MWLTLLAGFLFMALGDVLFLLAVAALAGWADRRATPAELEHRRSVARAS